MYILIPIYCNKHHSYDMHFLMPLRILTKHFLK